MAPTVAFFEVISPDHEQAQRFYADLFGWTIAADPAMGGYGLVQTDDADGPIGGIGPSSQTGDAGVRSGPAWQREAVRRAIALQLAADWPAHIRRLIEEGRLTPPQQQRAALPRPE